MYCDCVETTTMFISMVWWLVFTELLRKKGLVEQQRQTTCGVVLSVPVSDRDYRFAKVCWLLVYWNVRKVGARGFLKLESDKVCWRNSWIRQFGEAEINAESSFVSSDYSYAIVTSCSVIWPTANSSSRNSISCRCLEDSQKNDTLNFQGNLVWLLFGCTAFYFIGASRWKRECFSTRMLYFL